MLLDMKYEDLLELISQKSGISREELEKRINSKLEELSNLISKEGAAHIVANELGVNLSQEDKELKIKDILPGMRLLSLAVKVVNVYETREYQRNGHKGRVLSMLVADETGSTRLVVWDENIIDKLSNIKEGDILKIRGASCKSNINGFKELHLGSNSQVQINPENVTIGDVLVKPQYPKKKINELAEGDYVEVLGTIVDISDPRFYEICPECKRRAKPTIEGTYSCETHGIIQPTYAPLISFFLDDGTATIRVVAFREQVEFLLDLTKEEILLLKENPHKMESLRQNILGRQILIAGRVVRNELSGQLEFIANAIKEAEVKK